MPSTADVISLLKGDHRKVEALFEQFEKVKDTAGPGQSGGRIL